MYMPIWILYWFPFFLPINYGIKFAVINIVLWICKKVMNINDIYSISTAIKKFLFNYRGRTGRDSNVLYH